MSHAERSKRWRSRQALNQMVARATVDRGMLWAMADLGLLTDEDMRDPDVIGDVLVEIARQFIAIKLATRVTQFGSGKE